MQKRVIFIVFLLLFVVACATREYTFARGFKEMRAIDEKYNIDFHKEKLNGSMVRIDLVADVLKDLKLLQQKVNASVNGSEKQDVLDLLDARIAMIESERYWFLAKQIGPAGTTRDGFVCQDFPQVRDATSYLIQSWGAGVHAETLLDNILGRNKATWDIIGTNKEKPKFYSSPLDDVADDIRWNIKNMKDVCNLEL
ncbi:MAG: hypothetical protein Q7R96_06455 [Nanoarchaeota archaeon]|nr:hypothetical protein [Nanoarchaeota archaeon]